ncbi:putative B3 domain-containing protein [Panicum miliaceum]|uniref:B3 domain-containing protein n=1 Tax=Panicum miliaceum TaxID=4540 RepID=A0A3L6Q514_PANMI|nr:putative B3 domain-containing protein [Panicum miliaceum]
MGSSSGNRGARAIAISRHLKVLLPSSSSHKLRISDELARHWDGVGTALVVWRVQVARDAGGAFLRRGWPEFAAAHGFCAGWFLLFRHEAGGGVLTVKAFDTTYCLREFTRPISGS